MDKPTLSENLTLSQFFDTFHDYMETRDDAPPLHANDALLHGMYNDIRRVLNMSDDVTAARSDDVTSRPWQYDSDDWMAEYGHTYDTYMTLRPVLLCVILAILVLVGVIGNVVLTLAALRQNRHATSAFYAFLINLAVTNGLFVGFCIPLVIYENILMESWTAGEAMCQLQRYVQYCSFYALTYALLLLVTCTMLQVRAPRRIASLNTMGVGAAISLTVWGIIMAANIPNLLGHGLYDQIEGMTFCFHKALHGDWDKVRRLIIVQFMFSYALPFIAMATMSLWLLYHLLYRASASNYGNLDDNERFQKSSVTMNVTLTLLFALCWSPDRVLSLVLAYNPYAYGTFLFVISDLFMLMACCNAAANPWIILFILRHTLATSPQGEETDVTPEVCNNGDVANSPNRAMRNLNGVITSTTDIDADTNHLTQYLEMNPSDTPDNTMAQSL